MKPVSIGLVGFGNRGRTVGEMIVESPDLELVGVCDQLQDRREAASKELGVRTEPELSALLDHESIEAVDITTGTKSHAPLTIQALEAGKHVLCEKPLAETVEEGIQMVETADREGLVGATGYQKRFRPDNWTLRREAVKRNPVQVNLTNQRSIFRSKFFRPGYVWGILDGATHTIDIANWMFNLSPASVSGTVRYGVFAEQNTIDVVTLQIRYPGGRTATVTASMGGPGITQTRHVVGSDGNVEFVDDAIEVRDISFDDSYTEKERQRVSKQTIEPEPPGSGIPSRTLLEQFAARIRGEGGGALPTFRDGFDALAVAKAGLRSHERAETVHIADVAPEVPPR